MEAHVEILYKNYITLDFYGFDLVQNAIPIVNSVQEPEFNF
jgi:hypothetical protein